MERFRPFRIKNRYIVLACIVLGIVGWIFMPPVLPHIQVPAEVYPTGPLFTLPIIGDFYWTNTLTAMLIADILLVIIAVIVRRAAMSGELIPSGFSGAFEAIVDTMGHDRLMYGTDFHVSHIRGRCVAIGDSFHWFYADTMDLEEQHASLQPVLIGLESLRSLCLACHRLKLTDTQIEDIFYNNAARLFGLAE